MSVCDELKRMLVTCQFSCKTRGKFSVLFLLFNVIIDCLYFHQKWSLCVKFTQKTSERMERRSLNTVLQTASFPSGLVKSVLRICMWRSLKIKLRVRSHNSPAKELRRVVEEKFKAPSTFVNTTLVPRTEKFSFCRSMGNETQCVEQKELEN